MVFEYSINNRFAGMRLDVFLAGKYTYLTRNGWRKKIADGSVRLNGRPAKPAMKIPRDSVLSYDIGEYVERPVNTRYSVLHHDDDLLIVDKPPDIPVHTSGKYFNNTLIKVLRRDFPDFSLNLINRLDRETSGIILLGKTAAARREMGRQFMEQKVKKVYIAYVFGHVREDRFEVDAPIAEDVSTVVRIRMGVDASRGQPARTGFEVVRRAGGYTKLLCFPRTGRTNQIRVHLAHAGHPVVGDKLYSGDDRDFLEFIEHGNTPEILERVVMARQALHAHKLTFAHPVTGRTVAVVADEPEDMRAFERTHMQPQPEKEISHA